MTEPHEPIVGGWWRLNRYEVTDGLIRPTPRARLEEYDPWGDYEASRDSSTRTNAAGKRAFTPPYLSLIELLRELPYYEGGDGDPSALKPSGEELIADWCASNGLLGLLSQRVTLITLAPIEEAGRGSVQSRYIRTTDRGWIATSTTVGGSARTGKAPFRRPDPPEVVEPHAIVTSYEGPETREEPLSISLASFFPAVQTEQAATFAYPLPLSRAFWHTYAEPVRDFIEAAQLLARALRMLDEARFSREKADDPIKLARLGLRRLNRLVTPLSPSLHFVDNGFRQRWTSPSLLASFAMMALLDLEGSRVRACFECGRVFVTDAYQTRFCSQAHANRWRKRQSRLRAKSNGPATGE